MTSRLVDSFEVNGRSATEEEISSVLQLVNLQDDAPAETVAPAHISRLRERPARNTAGSFAGEAQPRGR